MNDKDRLFNLISLETAGKLFAELNKRRGIERKAKEKIKNGDTYWRIDSRGVGYSLYDNDDIDQKRILLNNFFRTEAEANKHLEKLEALKKVKDYIKDNFGVFEPDWDNKEQPKCYIYFSYLSDKFRLDMNYGVKNYSPFGYFKNKQNTYQLIEDMNTELKTIFGV